MQRQGEREKIRKIIINTLVHYIITRRGRYGVILRVSEVSKLTPSPLGAAKIIGGILHRLALMGYVRERPLSYYMPPDSQMQVMSEEELRSLIVSAMIPGPSVKPRGGARSEARLLLELGAAIEAARDAEMIDVKRELTRLLWGVIHELESKWRIEDSPLAPSLAEAREALKSNRLREALVIIRRIGDVLEANA
ncbi:MAG: hypothetical protein ACP5NY_04150 [Thermocladium sp.]